MEAGERERLGISRRETEGWIGGGESAGRHTYLSARARRERAPLTPGALMVLARMPISILSNSRGTPIRIVGFNSCMSSKIYKGKKK